jgi:hypothetical protein
MVADPADIRGWQRLSDAVTTSGRIEEGDVAASPRWGSSRWSIWRWTAIRRRWLTRRASLPAAVAMRAVPVPFDAPQEAHYEAFRAAVEAGPKPVHVHCIMNWRVSAFFYRLHRDEAGMPEAEARALMAAQWEPDAAERVARLGGLYRT